MIQNITLNVPKDIKEHDLSITSIRDKIAEQEKIPADDITIGHIRVFVSYYPHRTGALASPKITPQNRS